MNLLRCPNCSGRKQLCDVHDNFHNCRLCEGTGAVDWSTNERWIQGRNLRQERINRCETLMEAATKLGITAEQLSSIEQGKRHISEIIGACYDCGRRYGDKYGFPDLDVPDDIWIKISPKKDLSGLLCPSCMCQRAFKANVKQITAKFMSGPFCVEEE